MSTPVTNIPTTISYSVGSSPSTGPFTVPFAFFSTSDLIVYVGSYTPKTLGTDYTVSGALTGGGYPSGGTVTLTAGVSNTWVVITRGVPIQRVTQLPVSGKFNIDQLNQDLNVSYAIMQQVKTAADNAIHIPVDDYATAPTTALPNAAARALKGLKFDASGNVTLTASDPDSMVTAAAASATAAAASQASAASSASSASTSASTAITAATNASNSASAAAAYAAALPNASSIGSGKVPQSNGATWTGVTLPTGTVTSIIASTGLTGGTITSIGTIAVDTSVVATLNTANVFSKQQTPLKAALTDAATVAWDCSAAQVATLTTAASRTIGAPTNGVNGTSYRLVLTTGGYTPSWNAAFKFPGGTVPSSLTGTCVFDFYYDGTNFLCVGQNTAEA